MDRRGFLRGASILGAGTILGPGVVDLLGGEEIAAATQVAVVDGSEAEAPRWAANGLERRIYAHEQMFGELPKALFVNRYEMRELVQRTMPLGRYQDDRMARAGFNNLLLKGVPVVSVDDDVLYFDPRHRA